MVMLFVVVGNNRKRFWRTEVDKDFEWKVVDHELVSDKAKAENVQN